MKLIFYSHVLFFFSTFSISCTVAKPHHYSITTSQSILSLSLQPPPSSPPQCHHLSSLLATTRGALSIKLNRTTWLLHHHTVSFLANHLAFLIVITETHSPKIIKVAANKNEGTKAGMTGSTIIAWTGTTALCCGRLCWWQWQ